MSDEEAQAEEHVVDRLDDPHALDPDAAFSERAAAAFLGYSPRTLACWRLPDAQVEGPVFYRAGGEGGPVLYRRRRLVEWQAEQEKVTAEKRARKIEARAAKRAGDSKGEVE